MAKPVEDFPPDGRGRPERYPWDEWFDGQVWQLEYLEDYDCTPASMAVITRSALKRHGFTDYRVSRRGTTIYIQVNE